MEVVYKKTIMEQVEEAYLEAAKNNKLIDHVLLTESEATALVREIEQVYPSTLGILNPFTNFGKSPSARVHNAWCHGVLIKVKGCN